LVLSFVRHRVILFSIGIKARIQVFFYIFS
jgi:hypothetical protein